MSFADVCKQEPTHRLCRILELGDPESMTSIRSMREIGSFCLDRPWHHHPNVTERIALAVNPNWTSPNGRMYDALCTGIRDTTPVGRLSHCITERGIQVPGHKRVRIHAGDRWNSPLDDTQPTTNQDRLEYALSACKVRGEEGEVLPSFPGGRDRAHRFWADMPGEFRADCVDCTKSPCAVSDWSAWSECSKPCGGGQRERTREVREMIKGRESSCPALSESETCNTAPCPVDCQVSPWSAWSGCSKTCGGGQRSRTRQVTTQPMHGGAACPALQETQACNTQPCPTDCVLSEWSPWGGCMWDGRQSRFRTVITPAAHGGSCWGHRSEFRPCESERMMFMEAEEPAWA